MTISKLIGYLTVELVRNGDLEIKVSDSRWETEGNYLYDVDYIPQDGGYILLKGGLS